jgi:hypothetical protein
MHRPWNKPELVILARYQPAEAVLQVCKLDFVQPLAPGVWWGECWVPESGLNPPPFGSACGDACFELLQT